MQWNRLLGWKVENLMVWLSEQSVHATRVGPWNFGNLKQNWKWKPVYYGKNEIKIVETPFWASVRDVKQDYPSRYFPYRDGLLVERACAARTAVFKIPDQIRTTEYIGIRGTPLYQIVC